MKITIFFVVLIGLAVAWIRAQWAISKNKKQTKLLADGLRENKFTIPDLFESLHYILLRRPMPFPPDPARLRQKMSAIDRQLLFGKFHVDYAGATPDGKLAVIAEAVVKSRIESGQASVNATLKFPCWFYIVPEETSGEWVFYSVMPTEPEHQHVMEDFAKTIFKQLEV